MRTLLKGGITGGIGSGKTIVCKIFEFLGTPVYYADDEAKRLMHQNTKLRSEIQALFGNDAYLPDGTLNKAYLARLIFSDAGRREELNALVHPAVAADVEAWFNRQNTPYALEEAALLFESGSYQKLDFLITVYAPVELRLSRVMQRDKTSRKEVEKRMKAQWPDQEKIKKADFVVRNDGKNALIPQILDIHHQILQRVVGADR